MKNLDKAETKGGKKNSAFAPTGILAPLDGPTEEVAEKPKDDKKEDVKPD